MQWNSPSGQTYTTHPGSRLLFPALCRPTAPVTANETSAHNAAGPQPNRALAMPRRTTTRTQNRARAITEERKLNETYLTERNKPPPF